MHRISEAPVRIRRRIAIALAAAVALIAGLLTASVSTAPAHAEGTCPVELVISNQWSGGYTAEVRISALEEPINGWRVEILLPPGHEVPTVWNANASFFPGPDGGTILVLENVSWNANIPAGATLSAAGFNAFYSGDFEPPRVLSFNGQSCEEDEPEPEPRVNPYEDAQLYVNPVWSANAAAEPGGGAIADQPTALWLESVESITGGTGGPNSMGLEDHLDEAVAQGADTIQLVLYDIPGRNCLQARYESNDFAPDEIDRYQNEFIDVIVDIVGSPEYADLNIVAIIEPHSLISLVSPVTDPYRQGSPECDEVLEQSSYVEAIGYAVARLGELDNVYNYVDVGSSSRHTGYPPEYGVDDSLDPLVDLLMEALNTNGATVFDLHGITTNVADYAPLEEPFIDVTAVVGGIPVNQTEWLFGRMFIDEYPFAQTARARVTSAMIAYGFNPQFPDEIGVVIDTSRNGWGGPDRPTEPLPPDEMKDPEEYIEANRFDRRIDRGNWCNQAGSGLGEVPTAHPATGIDAYAWIKPPGESDGADGYMDKPGSFEYQPMCDSDFAPPIGSLIPSGALPGGPPRGEWFSDHFQELLANADGQGPGPF